MASQDKPLVSVIIPVYNVENFLSRCLDSILQQSYDKLEIIIVNDGSTDGSREICDYYKNKDPRVFLINKKNGGLSSARNEGIKKSKGDYVCFVDSDDYVTPNFVMDLFKSIKNNHTKISQCDVDLVDPNGKNRGRWTVIEDYRVINGRRLILDSLKGGNAQNIVVWNRMYARELLNANSFEEGRIHEDEFFTYKILYKQRVSIIHKRMYKYVQNPHGITKGKKRDCSYCDVMDAYHGKINYFIDNNDYEIIKALCVYVIRLIPSIIRKYCTSDCREKKRLISRLKQEYRFVRRVSKEKRAPIPAPCLIKTKLALQFPSMFMLYKRINRRDEKSL